jgi:predicted CoA-binding protein
MPDRFQKRRRMQMRAPESLSIVTPPHVTREVIRQAIAAGVRNIWMQPGAEDSQGSQLAREAERSCSF